MTSTSQNEKAPFGIIGPDSIINDLVHYYPSLYYYYTVAVYLVSDECIGFCEEVHDDERAEGTQRRSWIRLVT